MMGEQSDPRALVDDLVHAEQAGFDFSVASDHYFPWLDEQGHSPYVWSVPGAAVRATERIPLMTYVTCPPVNRPTRPSRSSRTRNCSRPSTRTAGPASRASARSQCATYCWQARSTGTGT
jgi:hypothetical protein